MDDLSAWILAKEVTVIEATLLMLDLDPHGLYADVEKQPLCDRPKDYETIKRALQRAINDGELPAKIRYHVSSKGGLVTYSVCYKEGGGVTTEEVLPPVFERKNDWQLTTIKVTDLKKWLIDNNFNRGYFLRDINCKSTSSQFPFLDKQHPCYSSKLAAVIYAWLAIAQNKDLLQRKTVKQALIKWLTENASDYDLVDIDGNPLKDTIEELAKIANWNPKGGAPKVSIDE